MPSPIRVARGPDGALTYAIPIPPEALPAVPPRDLEAAWERARAAAAAERWGAPRRLLFRRADGAAMELLLADADAACWAKPWTRRTTSARSAACRSACGCSPSSIS